jgi:hypothetical protein
MLASDLAQSGTHAAIGMMAVLNSRTPDMKTKQSRTTTNPRHKSDILPFVVLTLVIGSLILAVIDQNSRATFADLAKVGVGGYIGLMKPSNRTSGRK